MPEQRKRVLAGTWEYPALIIFHEKHDTEHYVVFNDDEVRYLANFKFVQRDSDNWYPSVEEAETSLARDRGMLMLREILLEQAPSHLPPRDEGYNRFDYEAIEREVEHARTVVKQSEKWLKKAQQAAQARKICAAEEPVGLNAVWNWLHYQEGEYEGITVQPVRRLLPEPETVDA